MALELPLRVDVAFFAYSIELDGATYGFEFLWNERAGDAGTWFVTVSDVSGVVLVACRRLVVDYPILARYSSDPRLPPGMLLAADMTGTGTDPGRNDLGARVVLLYFDAATLAAGSAGA